jgi:hypothetical protein
MGNLLKIAKSFTIFNNCSVFYPKDEMRCQATHLIFWVSVSNSHYKNRFHNGLKRNNKTQECDGGYARRHILGFYNENGWVSVTAMAVVVCLCK